MLLTKISMRYQKLFHSTSFYIQLSEFPNPCKMNSDAWSDWLLWVEDSVLESIALPLGDDEQSKRHNSEHTPNSEQAKREGVGQEVVRGCWGLHIYSTSVHLFRHHNSPAEGPGFGQGRRDRVTTDSPSRSSYPITMWLTVCGCLVIHVTRIHFTVDVHSLGITVHILHSIFVTGLEPECIESESLLVITRFVSVTSIADPTKGAVNIHSVIGQLVENGVVWIWRGGCPTFGATNADTRVPDCSDFVHIADLIANKHSLWIDLISCGAIDRFHRKYQRVLVVLINCIRCAGLVWSSDSAIWVVIALSVYHETLLSSDDCSAGPVSDLFSFAAGVIHQAFPPKVPHDFDVVLDVVVASRTTQSWGNTTSSIRWPGTIQNMPLSYPLYHDKTCVQWQLLIGEGGGGVNNRVKW